MRSFTKRFNFKPELHLCVGTERECFLTRDGKTIVPIAAEIISQLKNEGNFGYELSACQLEIRTDPGRIENITHDLFKSSEILGNQERRLGFKAYHTEVAPENMPLDVYPDPTGRYQEITKNMPEEKLRAACRVAGTHIHVGMESKEHAIKAYNSALPELQNLCNMGDRSGGERLSIYRIMAPDFEPPRYENWESYESYALEHGFLDNPRNCWHLIRISIHGTIEFRMFGATPAIQDVIEWTKYCHSICKAA